MTKKLTSIHSFMGGYDRNLSHIVTVTATGEQFLVDASIPLYTLKPHLTNLKYLGITHTHGDHIAYLREYIQHYPSITVAIHESAVHKIKIDRLLSLQDGSLITLDQVKIKVLHTPGHYPDSVCFLVAGSIFTGDTLFIGRTGRTVSPGSDIHQLYGSLYGKVLTLPQNTRVYPGHDYGPQPNATLEENILLSPLLQAQNEKDFIERMAAYEANRLKTKLQ